MAGVTSKVTALTAVISKQSIDGLVIAIVSGSISVSQVTVWKYSRASQVVVVSVIDIV